MAYDSTIALDLLDDGQSGKATTANALFNAMSAAALFGVKAVSGLSFGLYGGNMYVSGVPTAIASQTVTLTANATNYIYATSSGTVTKTTSIPGSWPGPLAAGAIALYTLVVGAASITSGTNYLLGVANAGSTGATGAQGNPGGTFENRIRQWNAIGGGSTAATIIGFPTATTTGATASARTLASSSFREAIPYLGYVSAGSSGSSAQVHSANNWAYLGNATGRGGFTLSMRLCMENSVNASPANQRSFFGLFVPGTIGNVEPDTLTNIIGVGTLAGDSNFRLMHNDGSGTATKTAFGTPGNFPCRSTDNVYELTLNSVANSGVVSWTFTDAETGNSEQGTLSSDLPSSTTFLSWVAWINNGSTAAVASYGLMQVVGETPY